MPRIARLIVNTIASRFYNEMGGLEATEKEGDKGFEAGGLYLGPHVGL